MNEYLLIWINYCRSFEWPILENVQSFKRAILKFEPVTVDISPIPPWILLVCCDFASLWHILKPTTTKNTSALRTLPRNTFSSLEQSDGAGGLGNLRTGPGGVPPPSLGERSKTLGPGFMRSHRDRMGGGSSGRVESGYISSPDGNYEFDARTDSLPHHHVPHSRDPQ